MFYVYSQNNSGGVWDSDYAYVIVQAHSGNQANAMAEDMGCYFNGVDEGIDCECCGDRWGAVEFEDDGFESLDDATKWMVDRELVYVKENVWVVNLEGE